MALEAVVSQEYPFNYVCKEYYNMGGYGFGLDVQEEKPTAENLKQGSNGYSDSPPSSIGPNVRDFEANNNSSPEIYGADQGGYFPVVDLVASGGSRRKRRRSKSMKNKEEMENQRMTHIAVERNRRRQMNDFLAILRSLMPPSYAQRGDQASIVGGAINYVKELEQLLQFLEAHKPAKLQTNKHSNLFSNFFAFPQYSTCPSGSMDCTDMAAERRSTVADIEVTMVESHANIKILSKRRPKQLFKLVTCFHSICLTILHLNVTSVDQSVLYSFSVKVDDNCQLTTVNEIATAIHDMVAMIQEEVMSS